MQEKAAADKRNYFKLIPYKDENLSVVSDEAAAQFVEQVENHTELQTPQTRCETA